jgi:hypothetical protein
MGALPIDKVSLTPQHLIVEYTSTESIFGMVAPSLKTRGVKVAGTQHLQVMRYVYTLARVEDIYFKGEKLQHMPGFRELLTEWVTPGTQLVSVPNGKLSIMHVYTGKKNIFRASALEKFKRSVSLNFIDLYGDDPAPRRVLYGNASVPFIQRGEENPMAAAYYNSETNRFRVLQQFDRRTLLENFQRTFANEYSSVG